MTCVCPVAGTTALTLGVPQARDAVHKAVQPRQYAKPKIRVRPKEEEPQVASNDECPTLTAVALSDIPLAAPAEQVVVAGNGLVAPASQVAEVAPPEAGVPLTARIFIPKPRVGSPSGAPEQAEVLSWVELMLGAG